MVFRDIPNTFALEGTRPILLVSESGSCGPDRLDWTRALRRPAHVMGREERTQAINLSSGQSALQNLLVAFRQCPPIVQESRVNLKADD